MSTQNNIVLVDVKVTPREVPYQDELNDTQKFGIHTHEVHKDDMDTDAMFNDSPIINVRWFETEEERDLNIIN